MRRTDEIDSAEELAVHIESGHGLGAAVIQGVDLGEVDADWERIDVAGAFFLGCRIADPDVGLTLQRGGAIVVPELGEGRRPYRVYPSRLYSYEDLVATGLDAAVQSYFESSRSRTGDPDPDLPVEAVAQRLHDTAMTDAIWDLVLPDGERPRRVAGIMGGHAVARDDPSYRRVAEIGYRLTDAGLMVATGGGPGIMEAGNLGAFLARRDIGTIDAAVAVLAEAPSVEHPDYGARADQVHAEHAAGPGGISLAIPTWHYGDEPVGRFASHIAKYFANSIREDGLLRVAGAGIVFAPGGAGTVQEIFQDLAVNAYAPAGERAPMVFLGTDWFRSNGVAAVVERFAAAAEPPFSELVTITDSVGAAVAAVAEAPGSA